MVHCIHFLLQNSLSIIILKKNQTKKNQSSQFTLLDDLGPYEKKLLVIIDNTVRMTFKFGLYISV